MFITMFCGILNLKSGDLIYANAGHNPPLVLRVDGTVEPLDDPPDLIVGVASGTHYEVHSRRLNPGDLLLLYTDGVTEAFDPALRPFGLERLLAALDPQRDPAAQCRALVAAVHAFADGAEPSDDITVLALGIGRAASSIGDGGATAPLHARLSPEGGRAGLAALADALDGLLLARRFPRAVLDDARLVVEEVLANVYDHGGRDGAPPWAELEVVQRGDLLWLHLRDDGPPWDPLQAPAPDLDAEIDDRPVGGLGIHLVRAFAAELSYAREGAINHLAVALHAPPADIP
jgi:sigma-B regulation protein RsbU (phosphoserine phosphatase)